MAVALTTSYKLLGKIALNAGDYTTEFRLYAKIGTQNISSNKTPVTTKIVFYREKGYYSFYSATGKITGTITGTKTYSTYTSMPSGETVVLETTKDITHNNDGTCTIKLGASWKDGFKNTTTKTISNVDCVLPKIPRASDLIPANTYVTFGSSVKIDIDRKLSTYKDTITWIGYYPRVNADGGYDLQHGEPSDIKGTIVEKTDASYIEWSIPNELSSLIPTFRFVGVKLICTTYNGDVVIGTTEKWIYARLLEEIANPLINYSYKETNQKLINQIGNDNFLIPVLNVSQPKFIFEAIPRYNATIKSLIITCDDGQSSNRSPHVFSPIGKSKFTIVAIDSRDYTTTIEIDLSKNEIPYIKPTIKTLEPVRESPISGEIILNAKGSWYGGTMIDDIVNPLDVGYKCKIGGSEGTATLVEIPKSAVSFDETKNEWNIINYNLGDITLYNKNYNFTLFIVDYYFEENLTKAIAKGIPTYDAGEHDLKVNGDLFVADEDGLNKEKINVSGKVSKNLFDKNNITNGLSYVNDGTITTLLGAFIQESYIPVESSTSYTFSTEEDLSNVENGRTVIMEYDDNYNFIKRTLAPYNRTLTITTTSNTKYTRLGGSSIGLETYQFEKGNKRTSYEEYYEPTLLIKCSNGAWISFNVNFLVD